MGDLLGLVLFFLILIVGAYLHLRNVKGAYEKISRATIRNSSMDSSKDSAPGEQTRDATAKKILLSIGGNLAEFQEEISLPQGSNFNAISIAAWSLLFVALAFIYFLTPAVFKSFNYYQQVPALASSSLGFFIFAVIILLTIGIIAIFVPKIYGFYEIPWKMKLMMVLTLPVLVISIICSIYVGTRYPENATLLWDVALLTFFASQLVLLLPVYGEAIR